jgi:hypothetical protein
LVTVCLYVCVKASKAKPKSKIFIYLFSRPVQRHTQSISGMVSPFIKEGRESEVTQASTNVLTLKYIYIHTLITLEQTPRRRANVKTKKQKKTEKKYQFLLFVMLLNKFPLSLQRCEYYACTPVIFSFFVAVACLNTKGSFSPHSKLAEWRV